MKKGLATLGPAVILVIMGFTRIGTLSVTLMTFAVGLIGFTSSGFNANILDISPAYSSLIFAMSNTLATIPGIVSPTLTEAILHPNGNSATPATAEAWRSVFYLAAGINVVTGILYFIFAKAHPVPYLK
mgnify:CR=1 FL=1